MTWTQLNEFVGRFVGDLGATIAAGSVVLGDRLGLYRALAAGGPATSDELAKRTDTEPRYVAEWLRGQAAGGYVDYDPAADSYSLNEEQAFALTDPDGPVYLPGAFRSRWVPYGQGRGSKERSERVRVRLARAGRRVFDGCERFFRPGYLANLVPSWLPALDGVEASKPEQGSPTSVAVTVRRRSCSRRPSRSRRSSGSTTTTARSRRPQTGGGRRGGRPGHVRGGVGADLRRGRPHLIATFDCLHDMGDPLGAALGSAAHLLRTARG